MTTVASIFPRLLGELFEPRAFGSFEAERLPERFVRRDGAWNGRPLVLETRAFVSQGHRLRVAEVRSDAAMESLTVLLLPPRTSGLSIFGADVVAFGGTLSAFIVDLTPKGPWAPRPRVASARSEIERSGTVRSFAADTETPFSPEVAFVQPRAGGETALVAGFGELLNEYATGAHAELEPHAAGEAEDAYLAKLSSVKRQAKVVAKLFGAHWTEGYFRCFFSPEIAAYSPSGEMESTTEGATTPANPQVRQTP